MVKKTNSWVPNWLSDGIIVLILVLIVTIPISPLNFPSSYRDSGVFLYMGWRILEGDLPYVDVWDHKPPVIYYINALGLSITSETTWGVWGIQLICLFLAAYLALRLLRSMFSPHTAIIGTFLWCLSLFFLIQGGNLTTVYVLPMQFAALSSFYSARSSQRKLWNYFFIGILGGLAFFTKQTVIGLWLAILLYLLVVGIKKKATKTSLRGISLLLVGGLLVPLVFILYFYSQGALNEFWDAAFLYNFAYTIRKVSGFKAWILNFIDFSEMPRTGIFHLSVLGIAAFFAAAKKKFASTRVKAVLIIAASAFPLELLLINAPGITFPHYYMSILPALAVLSSFIFHIMDSWIGKRLFIPRWVFTLSVICLLAFPSIHDYRNLTLGLQAKINQSTIQYVSEHSDPDDSVLIWGAETMVNFFTQRASPTRFVYDYPLTREAYVTEEKVMEFLDDIIENKPGLIINTGEKLKPLFSFPIISPKITAKLEDVRSMYAIVDEIDNSWEVYKPVTE